MEDAIKYNKADFKVYRYTVTGHLIHGRARMFRVRLAERMSGSPLLTFYAAGSDSIQKVGWFSPDSSGISSSPLLNGSPAIALCQRARTPPCFVYLTSIHQLAFVSLCTLDRFALPWELHRFLKGSTALKTVSYIQCFPYITNKPLLFAYFNESK